jgi:hypothetical protein
VAGNRKRRPLDPLDHQNVERMERALGLLDVPSRLHAARIENRRYAARLAVALPGEELIVESVGIRFRGWSRPTGGFEATLVCSHDAAALALRGVMLGISPCCHIVVETGLEVPLDIRLTWDRGRDRAGCRVCTIGIFWERDYLPIPGSERQPIND